MGEKIRKLIGVHQRFDSLVLAPVSQLCAVLGNQVRGKIGGHDKDGILAIDSLSLPV
jgi:hypothetical protein